MKVGLSPGDEVSYRKYGFGRYQPAVVVKVDTTELVPITLRDKQSGKKIKENPENIV